MNLNTAMRISSSGLAAERFRLDVISGNIANANSVSTNGKEAYRRKAVELIGSPEGVKVGKIVEDQAPLREESDPGNPNADKDGIVRYSNVNPITEMVDMLGASRAYEANVAAFNAAKGMIKSALNIGKV
ncbi:MAG: flagellar basal body rod protein FlgC [Fimbriimonadales bacterium]